MQTTQGYLAGQLLIAMPQMRDPRFARAVVFLCAHSADGAMGLVINREFEGLSFPELLSQLEIDAPSGSEKVQVHFGGPVEGGRGFVLHSADYLHETSMKVADNVALTATVDVLRAIADGMGPARSLLALGYAGWTAGQLDAEIRENAWLNVPADEDLLFGTDLEHKWEAAIHKLGIDFAALSGDAGHA
ncbi:MAG TPA: YqgE/AlgH family protein [Candidatus Omnitrophota bacterium]|nr:YqgE/AlgH family protein [Candidatus Omnitrophota bacterium]